MNRKQAENILDAFVLLSTTNAKAASDSLREVILDAMTSITYYPLTYPKVSPITEPYKPYVTWRTESASTSVNGHTQEVRANAD